MRKIIALVCFSLLAFFSVMGTTSFAAKSYVSAENGVGIALGTPGGITFFHKLDEKRFIQAYISQDLYLGADYALSFPNAIYAIPELTPFVGGGAFIYSNHRRYYGPYRAYDSASGTHAGIGARMPLGLLLSVPEAPVQFHIEIAPAVLVIPDQYTFVDAMLGVRFLF